MPTSASPIPPSPVAVSENQIIRIDVDAGVIEGELGLPQNATGVVLFAHGSGSSRHSPRNQFVAEYLRTLNLGTLLLDLLTEEEEQVDAHTSHHRFDIEFLADRLVLATNWLANQPTTQHLPIGYFGASTGAAATLCAAGRRRDIAAVVSRGGRPDLACDGLWLVRAPTLLIVGDLDYAVLRLNRQAFDELRQARKKELKLIAEATHLFEEPGALEQVARLAGDWFVKYLNDAPPAEDEIAAESSRIHTTPR